MTDCKNCNDSGCGTAAAAKTIPYIWHESIVARYELRERRMILMAIACAAASIMSNAALLLVLFR